MNFHFSDSLCRYILSSIFFNLFISLPLYSMEIEKNRRGESDFATVFKRVTKDYKHALNYLSNNRKKINFIINIIQTGLEIEEKFNIIEKAMIQNFYYAFFSYIEIKRIEKFVKHRDSGFGFFKRTRDNIAKIFIENFSFSAETFYKNPFQSKDMKKKLLYYYAAEKNNSKVDYQKSIDDDYKVELNNFIDERKKNLILRYVDIKLLIELPHPSDTLEYNDEELVKLQIEEKQLKRKTLIQKRLEKQQLKEERAQKLEDQKISAERIKILEKKQLEETKKAIELKKQLYLNKLAQGTWTDMIDLRRKEKKDENSDTGSVFSDENHSDVGRDMDGMIESSSIDSENEM